MAVTICDYMRERDMLYGEKKAELIELKENLNLLLKDEKVREYLEKKAEFDQSYQQVEDAYTKFSKEIQSECIHPLWIVPFTRWDFAKFQMIECVMCDFNKNILLEEAQELYENKRLISYDRRDELSHYLPIENLTKEDVRQYYYELSKIIENLKSNNYPVDFFTPESDVFNHFCKSEKVKRKTA